MFLIFDPIFFNHPVYARESLEVIEAERKRVWNKQTFWSVKRLPTDVTIVEIKTTFICNWRCKIFYSCFVVAWNQLELSPYYRQKLKNNGIWWISYSLHAFILYINNALRFHTVLYAYLNRKNVTVFYLNIISQNRYQYNWPFSLISFVKRFRVDKKIEIVKLLVETFTLVVITILNIIDLSPSHSFIFLFHCNKLSL